jgi:hypothetical protein
MSTEPGRFGPLSPDHPSVGEICPGCKKPLQAGDVPALVTIGPGDDEDARQRAAAGRVYNAVAVIAHEECVHGTKADRLEALTREEWTPEKWAALPGVDDAQQHKQQDQKDDHVDQ